MANINTNISDSNGILEVDIRMKGVDLDDNNYTLVELEMSRITDPEYEQFLADVWVGIVLTLMVLSCVCCMCSCLLYHKFQQWKQRVLATRQVTATNFESDQNIDTESLPSYTIVSGLPSYDEAIEQLRRPKPRETNAQKTTDPNSSSTANWVPQTPPTPVTRLTVSELFQLYRSNSVNSTSTATSTPVTSPSKS